MQTTLKLNGKKRDVIMPKITLGIVCHCDENKVEDIKNYIEMLDGDVIFIKTSWSRLWIKEGVNGD